MEGKLVFNKKENMFDNKSYSELIYNYNSPGIGIFTIDKNNDYSIDYYIGYEDKFEEVVENYSVIGVPKNKKKNFQDDRESTNFFQNYYGKEKELVKNAKCVQFMFEPLEIIKYIRDNPILRTKFIIVDEEFMYNSKLLHELKDAMGGTLDNICFSTLTNNKIIKYVDCKNFINIFYNIVKKLELYNFSNMEKIIYVYDLVRGIIYNSKDNDKISLDTREVINVLNSYEFGSVAYSNLFYNILNEAGIDVYRYGLYSENNKYGRTRNCIYIKDDKYKIDGVYFFDVEWDSKKNSDDNDYLNSYNFFAKTYKFFEVCNKENNLVDKIIFDLDYNLGEKVVDILKSSNSIKKENYISLINFLCNLSNKKGLIKENPGYEQYIQTLDLDVLKKDINEILENYYNEISAETMLGLLYNVRKVQYYENSELYEFSLKSFYHILINSNFKFKFTSVRDYISFVVFNELDLNVHFISNFIKYVCKNELDKNIVKVRLAKTLRKVYEKKNN